MRTVQEVLLPSIYNVTLHIGDMSISFLPLLIVAKAAETFLDLSSITNAMRLQITIARQIQTRRTNLYHQHEFESLEEPNLWAKLQSMTPVSPTPIRLTAVLDAARYKSSTDPKEKICTL